MNPEFGPPDPSKQELGPLSKSSDWEAERAVRCSSLGGLL